MLSLNAPKETTATDWCCQSEHGVMHRDLREACIKHQEVQIVYKSVLLNVQ